MRYKKMLKRKVYPTWISITKIKDCKVQILYIPSGDYYHFQIDYNSDVIYISLAENIKFDSFDECRDAAEDWIRNNVQNNLS